MKFDCLALGDHLPDPRTGAYHETQAKRYQMWVELGVRAEQLGFSGVLFGEHHCSNYIVSSPQMILAAIAAKTSTIRLGTAVSLLPNNDPVRLAEDFAALDLLSDGRAEIGFGSGFTEHTFRLFGQDIARSLEISAENLVLVQQLWNERSISWTGQFRTSIHDTELEPRTFSGRAIPISRATARSVETAEHAGRSGHKLMLLTAVGRFKDVKYLAAAYRDAYKASGHDPAGMDVAVLAYVHVQESASRAREYWRPYIDSYRAFGQTLAESKGLTPGFREAFASANIGELTSRECEADFVGDADIVIEKIQRANEDVGGVDRLLCYFDAGGLSRTDTLASMQLFAEHVMPAVSSL